MKAMYNGKELTVAMFGGGVIRGTLESIEIVRDAFRTVYLSGTPFEPDGIVVLAHFSSGETRYVPQEELTFSPTGGLAFGTTAVTVDFTYGDVTARATQKISVSNNYIFGVCWNYGEPSSQLTRLTPSNDPNRLVTIAVTTEPVPAVGTGPGSSPFDQHLPWSGMEEYNIVNNAVRYKKGQSGFSRTNYDTVVYIPEFYYRVIDDAANSKRYWYVSSKSVSGFAKHPGSGKYVGRYHAGADYVSKTELWPLVNMGRKDARTGCQAKGSKWSMYDYAAWCAVWLLYLVEFADWNSQEKIGYGITSGSIQSSGKTDVMTYHTGRAAEANSGKTAVQYRGIENPWGNVLQWVDGINFKSNLAYICTNPAQYADATNVNYTESGVTLSSQSERYISKIGLSNTSPWAFLPTEKNGSDSTYIPDVARAGSASWTVLCIGGYKNIGLKAGGLFCMYPGYGESTPYDDRTTRIQYNP